MHQSDLNQRPLFGGGRDRHRLTYDAMVVSRRISAPARRIGELLADQRLVVGAPPARTQLALSSMVLSDAAVGVAWSGYARIRPSGRARRTIRVRLEIACWSDDSGELRISPARRHLPQWGAARLRRYFSAAHAAADQLWRDLQLPRTAAVPGPVAPAAPTLAVLPHGRPTAPATEDSRIPAAAP